MKFEEIQSLMNFGFTPDQIMALARDEPIPPSEPAPDPEQNSPPDPTPSQAPEQESNPAPAPDSPTELDSLRDEIKKLTATIQSQNIKTASVDKIADPEAETDKIMAEFIRPAYEKKEIK